MFDNMNFNLGFFACSLTLLYSLFHSMSHLPWGIHLVKAKGTSFRCPKDSPLPLPILRARKPIAQPPHRRLSAGRTFPPASLVFPIKFMLASPTLYCFHSKVSARFVLPVFFPSTTVLPAPAQSLWMQPLSFSAF